MAPSPTYRALRSVVRAFVRLFFRDVTVEGRYRVPTDRGGLFVAWHPNGIIDPALILSAAPTPVVFGARDGLLRWPLVGAMMRGLGTVPIYRSQDQDAMSPEARRAANARSLGALADAVADGAYSALFPEGVSHDRPGPVEIRHGAARLWQLAAASLPEGAPPPALVPVGLHYEAKSVFRSDVVVRFLPPLDAAVLTAGLGEAEAAEALTGAIEAALDRASHALDDWDEHRLMLRTHALLRAEGAVREGRTASSDQALAGQVAGTSTVWERYQALRNSHPEQTAALRAELADYDRRLQRLGLDSTELDAPPRIGSPLKVLGIALVVAVAAVLAPVLLLWGLVVNILPYWALKPLARRFASAEKDEATIKLMGGVVLFPLAWTVASALVAFGVVQVLPPGLSLAPVAAAFAAGALAAVGGGLVIRAVEIAQATARNLRVQLVRDGLGERLATLRTERAALYDRIVTLAGTAGVPAGR